MTKKSLMGVLGFAALAALGGATPVRADWNHTATSGSDNWLIGADSATGKLIICDTVTNMPIAWPSAPNNPLDQNGKITMLDGHDFLRIVTNTGTWDCGTMYAVNYGAYSLSLVGGDGDDWIIGGAGPDIIYGDYSDSECFGTTGGDDILASGGGADYIYGCAGNDIFDTEYTPGPGTTVEGNDGADCIEADENVTLYCVDGGTTTDGEEDKYNGTDADSFSCHVTEDTSEDDIECFEG